MLSIIVLCVVLCLVTLMACAGWKSLRRAASNNCQAGRSEYMSSRQSRI